MSDIAIKQRKDPGGLVAEISPGPDAAAGEELSFAEELIWQAENGGPTTSPFIDCARSLWLIMHFHGPVEQEALKSSLNAVVQRHHVLRSRFVARNGQVVRVTSPTPSSSFKSIKSQGSTRKDPREILESEIRPLLEHPVDLAYGPLLRAVLFALSREEYILAISVHHIVFDRWSTRLLESELRQFYSAHVSGRKAGVRPLPVQYQQYVLWQREQLNSEHVHKLSKYWKDKLSGLPDLILSGYDTCVRKASSRAGSVWFRIPAEEVSRLEVLSRQSRTTLAATMLMIFTLLIYRLSGIDDIAVGVPLSDRRRPEVEEVIGLFMNVVIVRTSISSSMTFLELLDRVRRGLVDACLHQGLPYGYLRHIVPARPLYRVIFNFLPTVLRSELQWDGLKANLLPVSLEPQSLADFSLHLRHDTGALFCRFLYKADLFPEDFARSFAAQIQALTRVILQAPQKCIDTYHLDA